MKFDNLDIKRNYLQEEIKALEAQVVSLHKEKDQVLEQIKDQRNGY